tara:strand:- start:696 stop:2018 length:1323 start_codon:yes stop_codon:yes gene_type:complete
MKFTNVLRDIILEASRYEVLVNKFSTPKKKASGKVIKPKIPLDVLQDLMQADPTTKGEFEGDRDTREITKVGKYSQWLIKQWMSLQQKAQEEYEYDSNPNSPFQGKLNQLQEQFLEDLYKTTDDLKLFSRFKHRVDSEKRDINKVNSVDELYDLVKDFQGLDADETKAEKKERIKRDDFEIVYDGDRWEVGIPLTKDVSCEIAGPPLTRWCTASAGHNWYDNYAKQGPLFVIRDKNNIVESGKGAGEPKPMYQFHFESNNFMDEDDRNINLENFLNNEGQELKPLFKEKFADAINKEFGKKIQINYPNDKVSRYIALYGFDELFERLPQNLERFDFEVSGGGRSGDKKPMKPMTLPPQLLKFKNLQILHIEGLLESLPENIDSLQNLQFISIPHNPNMTSLPASLANLPNLEVLNIRGNNIEIPPALEEKWNNGEIVIVK